MQKFVVDTLDVGSRLDVYLAKVLVDKYSRTKIKKMIQDGNISVTGQSVTAHYQIHEGDVIQVEEMEVAVEDTRAQNIPIEILYEDEGLMIVNKPAGLVVHPAHGNPDNTLVNALLYHTQNLSHVGGMVRPGIVHRLDKDTSGVMVVAKNDRVHANLANQFKKHTIERVYYAFVRGIVQHDEGKCEEPVGRAFLNRKKVVVKPSGGKNALTFFKVLKRYRKNTLLEIRPQTGRTHQIRVHVAYMGHPMLGDSLYGVSSPWINRHALHAAKLGIVHPETGERMKFESEFPEDMKYLQSQLEAGL